jgi:hypothetical protein
MAINKIQMIAHPFYWFFDARDRYPNEKFPRDIPQPVPAELQTGERAVLKMCASHYGRVVNEVKKDPKQLLVIVGVPQPADRNAISEQYERVFNYAKRSLGKNSRLIVAPPEFAFESAGGRDARECFDDACAGITKKLANFKFEKNIEILTTGMLKQGCVERGANHLKHVICEMFARGKIPEIEIHTKPGALSMDELASFRMYACAPKRTALTKWKKKTFGKRQPPKKAARK